MGHDIGLEDDYSDMKDEWWLKHYKVCAMELMISDHERLKEKNTRLESEKTEQGTIKQQISRAIEQDKREHDIDLKGMISEQIKETISSLSTEQLENELKKRKLVT